MSNDVHRLPDDPRLNQKEALKRALKTRADSGGPRKAISGQGALNLYGKWQSFLAPENDAEISQ